MKLKTINIASSIVVTLICGYFLLDTVNIKEEDTTIQTYSAKISSPEVVGGDNDKTDIAVIDRPSKFKETSYGIVGLLSIINIVRSMLGYTLKDLVTEFSKKE